ncbi:MAG: IclR family transcriptional regulator [Chloroflexota bacterium]
MPKVDGNTAVSRALAVLGCFTAASPELTLSDISARIGSPLSTVHRIATVLEADGLLTRDLKNGRYRLGLKIVALFGAFQSGSELCRQALPYLRDIAASTGLNANVGVLVKGEVLYVARVVNPHFSSVSFVGLLLPAHCCAMGKVLLAYQPWEQVESVVNEKGLRPFTSSTISSRDEFFDCLEQVKIRGYAIDRGELTPDSACVAAPIRARDVGMLAALSVSGPADVVSKRPIEETAAIVCRYADRISFSLGHGMRFA